MLGVLRQSKTAQWLIAELNATPVAYDRFPVAIRAPVGGPYARSLYRALVWKLELLESAESRWLIEVCAPGMHVVDAGANIGVHTVLMSERVGPAGHVWAFEPDARNFAMLERNLSTNGCPNVTAVNAAVAAETREIWLHHSRANAGDHRIYASDDDRRMTSRARAVALDDCFASERIDLVKLDVQGAEGLVLAGMRQLLAGSLALTLVLELWPAGIRRAGSDPLAVHQDLTMSGFRLASLEAGGKLRDVVSPSQLVAALGGKGYTTVVARKGAHP